MIQLYPYIKLKNGALLNSQESSEEQIVSKGQQASRGQQASKEQAVSLANSYVEKGASGLFVLDLSCEDAGHEETISVLREMSSLPRPVYAGGHVKRLEDVKKYLYAGCVGVVIDLEGEMGGPACLSMCAEALEQRLGLLKEGSLRFGKEKCLVSIKKGQTYLEHQEELKEYGGGILCTGEAFREICAAGSQMPEMALVFLEDEDEEDKDKKYQKYQELSSHDSSSGDNSLYGVVVSGISEEQIYRAVRENETGEGIETGNEEADAQASSIITFGCMRASYSWEELKKDEKGLLPVVVQEVGSHEVLMVAYMNQEAYETTLRTGIMTYYSRSRQELWVKGLTSGHFQYVKSLMVDCDQDTLLANVIQVGAACHTGNHSCFYRNLAGHTQENEKDASLSVLSEVYEVIKDRKEHPKEGSYTNYLFDKGIDKILKKVGEEATEIVIAAKNPDKEEVKYEISDFLYHVMVLMVEKGLSWEEVAKELANR